jgi:anti-anti-sigma factor
MHNIKLRFPRLGWTEVDALGDQLLRLADGEAGRGLFLDLADVEFLTAALLGKLVTLHLKVRQRGGKLTLLNVNPFVYEIFAVTQLIHIINIRPRLVA